MDSRSSASTASALSRSGWSCSVRSTSIPSGSAGRQAMLLACDQPIVWPVSFSYASRYFAAVRAMTDPSRPAVLSSFQTEKIRHGKIPEIQLQQLPTDSTAAS